MRKVPDQRRIAHNSSCVRHNTLLGKVSVLNGAGLNLFPTALAPVPNGRFCSFPTVDIVVEKKPWRNGGGLSLSDSSKCDSLKAYIHLRMHPSDFRGSRMLEHA